MDYGRIYSLAALLTLVCGCGRATDGDAARSQDVSSDLLNTPMTVSLTNPDIAELPADGASTRELLDESELVAADDDEAALMLRAIRTLRADALPEKEDAARKELRRRNLKVVDLSAKIIAITVHRKDQSLFRHAVREFLEARFQLALNGDDHDVDQLYTDVRTLNDRDPASFAAAEGVYYLARFAHNKARLAQGDEEPVWLHNFARWSREFAQRFPEQRQRAAALLFGAGRSCEMQSLSVGDLETSVQLMEEARRCYVTLTSSFGETDQGEEAQAVLRRLDLPGQKLSQFAGPTLSGEFLSAEELTGRVTLIYFWGADNDEFVDHLIPLLRLANAASNQKLWFVGVSLDPDEQRVRKFAADEQLPGRQVFFDDERRRGWDNPIVRFWGVSRIPSVWLIDRDGTVNAVDVRSGELVEATRRLFQ